MMEVAEKGVLATAAAMVDATSTNAFLNKQTVHNERISKTAAKAPGIEVQ
jgi:hypothetical protein